MELHCADGVTMRLSQDLWDKLPSQAAKLTSHEVLDILSKNKTSCYEPHLEVPRPGVGALIPMVRTGVQDNWSKGAGFNTTYGKHLPPLQDDRYVEESAALLNESVGFNSTKRIPIQRIADAVSNVLCKVVLPALPSGVRWRHDVAARLIERFRLEIGGQPIYDCTGLINAALCMAMNKWPANEGKLMVFPLALPPMWSDHNLLPIVALQYHDVTLTLDVCALDQLVVGKADGMPTHCKLVVEADYVFCEGATRARLAMGAAPPDAKETKETKETKKPTVQLAHEQCARVVPAVHPDGAQALRDWFDCVDAAGDRAIAQERGLWDGCLDCNPTLLQQLVDQLSNANACQGVVRDPRCLVLWRFAHPEAALLAQSKGKSKGRTVLDDKPQTIEPQPSKAQITFLPQIQCRKFALDARPLQKFELNFSHPCSALLLAFTCADEAVQRNPEAHPFDHVRLILQGHEWLCADPVKAHDWNWLHCGANAPSAQTKFYLLPFSKHALQWTKDGLPSTCNMSRIDKVELELTLNRAVQAEWTLQVGAINSNLLQVDGGMGAVRFSI
jgi:hypothetical protein